MALLLVTMFLLKMAEQTLGTGRCLCGGCTAPRRERGKPAWDRRQLHPGH